MNKLEQLILKQKAIKNQIQIIKSLGLTSHEEAKELFKLKEQTIELKYKIIELLKEEK